MCGVAFLYDAVFEPELRKERCAAGVTAQHHRGPDGRGFAHGQNWSIGHARLAIVDLNTGAQPITDVRRRWWLSFNGEIYNYRELREQLRGGWIFRTESDSEVLLAGLVLYGTSFLHKLNGMWAFVLWDSEEEQLLACRDRLGKKPLYYHAESRGIALASELPALRKIRNSTQPPIDFDSLADTLRYGAPLPGFTVYEGYFDVLPGYCMTWSHGTGCKHMRYWEMPAESSSKISRADAAESLLELLESAVAYRLIADVEVGCLLSGGLDSTVITAMAAKQCRNRIKTFSMGNVDTGYDESEHAKRAAMDLSTEHYNRHFSAAEVDCISRLINHHVGMPFGDASILPTHALAALAASELKVVLSGDGADELFCGYQRYLAQAFLRWYTRVPYPLRFGADKLLKLLPEPLEHHSKSLLKKAKLFLRQEQDSRGRGSCAYVAPRYFSDSEIASIAPPLATRGHQVPHVPDTCRLDELKRMLTMDALVYLPQDILVKTDRASMAHSLELRAPFLDYRIVELAMSLPATSHIGRFSGKQLLRRATHGRIPGWVGQRRKQGFSLPVGSYFRGNLGTELVRTMSDNRPQFLEVSAVANLVQEHRFGRTDHGQRLWLLWTTALWIEGLH